MLRRYIADYGTDGRLFRPARGGLLDETGLPIHGPLPAPADYYVVMCDASELATRTCAGPMPTRSPMARTAASIWVTGS